MLRRHTLFISRVSLPRAEMFVDEFEAIAGQLKENPFLYPLDEDDNLPVGKYRKAVFAKWYKLLFWVKDTTVYIDAVCDCREDLTRIIQ